MSKWARINGNRVAEITDIDPDGRFHPSIKWEPVPDDTKPGMVKDGSNYRWPDPEPEPIPTSITARQGEQQLILSGLDEQVEAAIDGIADTTERKLTRAWYNRASTWERNNPQLIALGKALGLTDEKIDDLFKQASEL